MAATKGTETTESPSSTAERSAAPAAGDRDFVITRVIDAPPELVFRAWTDPKHLARWWGPRGFTNPVCEMDARPGGRYRIVMRSPDGVDYPMFGVIREIVVPERIVMTDDCAEQHPADWQETLRRNLPEADRNASLEGVSTVTFEEHDGKTKLTVRTRFATAGVRDAFLEMGMNEGWSESLEKLEELLATA